MKMMDRHWSWSDTRLAADWDTAPICSRSSTTTMWTKEGSRNPGEQTRPSKGERMNVEVIGIDHIYISVTDMLRSEQFYDKNDGCAWLQEKFLRERGRSAWRNSRV